MRRRTLIATAATATLAGCLDLDTLRSRGENDDENSPTVDGELSDEAIEDLFATFLRVEGVEPVHVARENGVFELEYEATGTTDEDVLLEIEIVVDGYTSAIREGVGTDRLEASSLDPDAGTELDSFRIETEWVEAYIAEEIEWLELLTRVEETFESDE